MKMGGHHSKADGVDAHHKKSGSSHHQRLENSSSNNNDATASGHGTPTHVAVSSFSPSEIRMLHDSFEDMKAHHRDEMTMELIERAHSVPGAEDLFNHARTRLADMGHQWIFMNIGMIIMSGVERCLLRVGNATHLRESLHHLKGVHADKYHVPHEMMAKALQVCVPVFKQENMSTGHNGHGAAGEKCMLCDAWERFICNVVELLNEPM